MTIQELLIDVDRRHTIWGTGTILHFMGRTYRVGVWPASITPHMTIGDDISAPTVANMPEVIANGA